MSVFSKYVRKQRSKNNVNIIEYCFGKYMFRITKFIPPKNSISDYVGNDIEVFNLDGDFVCTLSSIVKGGYWNEKEVIADIIPFERGMYTWREYIENCVIVNGYFITYLINFETLTCIDKWMNK